MDQTKPDDKYEIESLASDIRRTEMAKKEKPELYAKAIAKLKGEAKAIMSLADLKAKRIELEEKEDEDMEEES